MSHHVAHSLRVNGDVKDTPAFFCVALSPNRIARFIFNTELIISEIARRTGHNSETLRITFALKFHHFHYEIVDLRQ
jgi:hypothetical protein